MLMALVLSEKVVNVDIDMILVDVVAIVAAGPSLQPPFHRFDALIDFRIAFLLLEHVR
jgi:hypothetical protein